MKRDSKQDEEALLDQLSAIERSVQQLETLQTQRSDMFKQQLVTMEGRLNSAVTDLYTRHTQRWTMDIENMNLLAQTDGYL